MIRLTEAARVTLHYLLALQLPEDVPFDVDVLGNIEAQCTTQDELRRFRASFPGVLWNKLYDADLKWWRYYGKSNGRHIHIYACREAPPTCRAIVEMVEVEEKVPVVFETRKVQRERVRWECDGEKEATA